MFRGDLDLLPNCFNGDFERHTIIITWENEEPVTKRCKNLIRHMLEAEESKTKKPKMPHKFVIRQASHEIQPCHQYSKDDV